MAKTLVIKGENFSSVSFDVVAFPDEPTTIPIRESQGYVIFLQYSGSTSIRQTPSSATDGDKYKLIVAKVDGVVGMSISITSATPVISNAYYACFSASLGCFSFNDVPNIGMSPTSEMIETPITPIGSTFNISSVYNQKETITKTVPSGAVYLLFSACFLGDLQESDISVELNEQS